MRRIAWLWLVLALGLIVPGPASAGQTQKTYTFAVLVKDSTTPFWRYLISGAKKEAKAQGVEVIEYAPLQQQNLEEQMRHVEDAIQKKVDAIIIAPINPTAIIPAIEKANAAKIPVLTTNSKAGGGKIETFVGVENYEGAKKLGEYMLKKINRTGSVIIVEGNPAGQTNQDRVKGFREAIAAAPEVKLLAQQPAMFRRDQAMTVMENLLQTHPKVDLVIALNDEMALGSLKALEQAGRKGVVVSGFDGAIEGLEAILAGRLAASLNQDPFGQGALPVRAAMDLMKGKKIPANIPTGGEIIDIGNAQQLLNLFKEAAK
jgi:ribose transport system substrate-binding protein